MKASVTDPADRRHPPRLAEAILRRALPHGKRGESMLGDLREEFRALASQNVARRWYWLQALRLSLRYAPQNIRPAMRRRGSLMPHDLRSDLRTALRMFVRNPGTSAIIVFTLATAIGAATIGFAFADLALFRGLPVDDSSRVVSVFAADTHGSNPRARVSGPDYLDYRARLQTLERISVFRQASAPLISSGQSRTLTVSYATADFFAAMGQTTAALGRVLGPGDDAAGAPRVALLSHRYWREEYSGRADALSHDLQIGRDIYRIVGVVTAEMEVGNIAEIDVWLPLHVSLEQPRDVRNLRLVARLREGVTFEQAAAEIAVVGDALAAEHPDTNGGWRTRLVPIRDVTGGQGFWVVVALFLLSIGLLIAIATANVSNLVMVRTLARQRELAVRSALGAAGTRLIRQLVIEGLALSTVSAVVALPLAYAGLQLIASLSPEPILHQLRIDQHEFGFVATLVLICPLIFSLAPARTLSRADMRQLLAASGGRSVTASIRGRGVLVVAQVALAVILLIASGLALRSIRSLYTRPIGIQPHNLLVFTLDFNDVIYPTTGLSHAAAIAVRDGLRTIDGVDQVAMVDALPILGAESLVGLTTDQQVPAEGQSKPTVLATETTEEGASVLGLKVLAGRWWQPGDTGVAVIGRETAVRYMGGVEGAVAQTIGLWRAGKPSTFRVVGVINDVATGDAMDWTRPRVWIPIADTTRRHTFVVRTRGEPSNATAEIRATVARVSPAVPIESLSSMPDALERAASSDYVIIDVLAGFALLALVLASTGLFGVVSFSAAQRTAEFGTRIALGASTLDVVRLVARQSLALLAAGVGLGLMGGIAVAFSMQSVLYDMSPLDPITIGGATALLTLVTLIATAMPAWRAGRIDPITALRSE